MRGPFARMRQARSDDRELGTGLWRRAHDRFARALDRYWQVLDDDGAAPLDGDVRNGLVHAGNVLTDHLPQVRSLAARLNARHPETGEQRIPGQVADVHRELSRAAHELAAAAQAVALVRLGQADSSAVGRHAERTLDHVRRAQELAGAS